MESKHEAKGSLKGKTDRQYHKYDRDYGGDRRNRSRRSLYL